MNVNETIVKMWCEGASAEDIGGAKGFSVETVYSPTNAGRAALGESQ